MKSCSENLVKAVASLQILPLKFYYLRNCKTKGCGIRINTPNLSCRDSFSMLKVGKLRELLLYLMELLFSNYKLMTCRYQLYTEELPF